MDSDQAKEAIRILFEAMEKLLVELVAHQGTLDLICEHWPGDEPLDWHLLLDADMKDKISQKVSDRFRGIRTGLLGELEGNHPPLPEGWQDEVRRLIESAGDFE